MSDVRVVVKIDGEEYPDLAAELESVTERSRAKRLRYLANIGLQIRSGRAFSLPSNTVVSQGGAGAESSPSETEAGTVNTSVPQPSTPKLRRPPRAGSAMVSVGANSEK